MADKDPLGDRNYRDADEKLTDAVAVFNAADPALDFVAEMADLIDGYDNTDHDQTILDLQQIEAVYDNVLADRYYVIGNHELEDITLAEFQTNTGMPETGLGYYSFDVGSNLHVVVLDACYYDDDDTTHYAPGNFVMADTWIPPNERTWLDADLAANADKEVIVFIHQRLDGTDDVGYYVNNSVTVRTILERYLNVRHVFQGHRHENAHQVINTIGYHVLEAMTELAYPNNSYAIVQVFDKGWVTVTGYDRAASYSLGVPVCH